MVRLFKSLVLGAVAMVSLSTAVQAQQVCPHCGRVHSYTQPMTSNLQMQAQAEARLMASRSYKGHVQGTLPGVSFCGVGWSSSSTPSTCTPSSPMTLVADATVRGNDGWYRVRYWR
ncbi:MAG: hypothetical protein R3C53_01380 [Pirellulaceae bacterium]